MLRIAIAVVVAGIVGTLANSVAVAAAIGAPFAPLALSPGRHAVAILVAGLLPLIDRMWRGMAGQLVALALLTVVPSLLAKLVFGIGAPWLAVLLLNAVYALAAIVAYRLMLRRGAP